MAKYIRQKQRVPERDEQVIQEHAEEIERSLEARDVVGSLYSRSIINLEEKQEISDKKTRVGRARLLIEILILSGPNAFPGFVNSLRAHDYHILANKLSSKREELKKTGTSVSSSDSESSGEAGNTDHYLTERVDDLEDKVNDLMTRRTEMASTDHEDMQSQMETLKDILLKIEEQSRVNRKTEETINELMQQLKDKEELLEKARSKIEELEKKIKDLQETNLNLSCKLSEQQKDFSDLKTIVEDEREKRQEAERNNLLFQEEMRKEMAKLKKHKKTKPKIIPQNRFQPK